MIRRITEVEARGDLRGNRKDQGNHDQKQHNAFGAIIPFFCA